MKQNRFRKKRGKRQYNQEEISTIQKHSTPSTMVSPLLRRPWSGNLSWTSQHIRLENNLRLLREKTSNGRVVEKTNEKKWKKRPKEKTSVSSQIQLPRLFRVDRIEDRLAFPRVPHVQLHQLFVHFTIQIGHAQVQLLVG